MRLGRRGWVLGMLLGLLGGGPLSRAADFTCPAGDVACLKAAITTANGNGDVNTITLAAGTYTLTAVDNDMGGPNGLPSITSEFLLTIRGAKAETTIIERQPRAPGFRLIHVAATGTLALERLTLQAGNSGGATFGGGIFNNGTLTLTNSTVSGNAASLGGGIFNDRGTLTVTQSTITDNTATGYGGILNDGGTVTITNSTIAYSLGVLESGGLANLAGTVVIAATTFADNLADGASAILNKGTLTVTDSSFSDNLTVGTGTGTIINFGVLEVTNTTFARNVVVHDAGEPLGAGIKNLGTLVLTNSTLADNRIKAGASGTAPAGGALTSTSGAITILQNTVLACTVKSMGFSPGDCIGVVTSLGTNLIGDPTGCIITRPPGVSDLTGDPGLDAFTDDFTPGHGHFPLLATSQAINAGNEAACPLTDQVGHLRVGRCDIGAVEFTTTAPLTLSGSPSSVAPVHQRWLHAVGHQ